MLEDCTAVGGVPMFPVEGSRAKDLYGLTGRVQASATSRDAAISAASLRYSSIKL